MPKFIVRPYYGHDCDSESGFNNGYYLDEIEVEAADAGDAVDEAMYWFRKHNLQVALSEDWIDECHMGDDTLYREVDCRWVDKDGNEYDSEPEDVEAECYYLYQYIDFTDVREGALPDPMDKKGLNNDQQTLCHIHK